MQEASSSDNTQQIEGNYVKVQKLGKRWKLKKIFENGKNKTWILENVNRKRYAKFQEGSSIGNTQKSWGTMHDINIFKSTNWKYRIYFKDRKTENLVLGNFIRQAHAKFQEASSMWSMQKSRETAAEMSSVWRRSFVEI